MPPSEKLAVHADNHGRPELIYAVDRYYGGDVKQLVIGDVFDGPDTKGSMQALCDVEASMLLGNHEWIYAASVLETDRARRLQFASAIWPRIHDRVLQSYGVYPSIPSPKNAERLYEKMPESHKGLLDAADLFYETKDFVTIHAGITAQRWPLQRRTLSRRQTLRREQQRYVVDEDYIPHQIYEPRQLADRNTVLSGVGKLVINGHFHRPFEDFESRYTALGARLYLATNKNDSFAVVWESWTRNLVRINNQGQEIDRQKSSV